MSQVQQGVPVGLVGVEGHGSTRVEAAGLEVTKGNAVLRRQRWKA